MSWVISSTSSPVSISSLSFWVSSLPLSTNSCVWVRSPSCIWVIVPGRVSFVESYVKSHWLCVPTTPSEGGDSFAGGSMSGSLDVCYVTSFLYLLLSCCAMFYHMRPRFCPIWHVGGGWRPLIGTLDRVMTLLVTVIASRWLSFINSEHYMTCHKHMRRHVFFEIQFHNFDSVRYLVSILYRPLFVLNIFTSPYFDITSRKTGSFTSGGKPATLTCLTPMRANSTFTMDISPLPCLYSSCPCMFWSIDWFSLPRRMLYILSCVAHLSVSFGYRLLADAVVRISIHVHWRRLSSGFSCQKYRLSCSVILPFPCDAVESVTHSLTFT